MSEDGAGGERWLIRDHLMVASGAGASGVAVARAAVASTGRHVG